MADPEISPISQLLNSLGITREDLNKRSDQMRQFLTAQDAISLRVLDRDNTNIPTSGPELRSSSKTSTSTAALARSVSCASSSSLRDASPPVTPVKSEPLESGVPLRHFDSMEMVIERQRRQNRKEKKGRKDKERDLAVRMTLPHPHSPSPSNASQPGFSLDSFMQSRDDRRVPAPGFDDTAQTGVIQDTRSVPSITSQRTKYYREHTNVGSTSRPQRRTFSPRAESPTPTRNRNRALSKSLPQPLAFPQPRSTSQSQFLPPPPQLKNAQASSSALPVTPQRQRIYAPRQFAKSPLPASSPPPASSPFSSPTRRVVNTVSSPGPMGPLPLEEEYDALPYNLPPGPYSPNKPDLSYAALVGRAIISSPEHRLTLQEIYDWITIVFPHFKRGETTWMNSIRHVLSTTVCFRKVTRERSVGRTLWAIWDEDLPCFKGGGFRKHLCRDIVNGAAGGGQKAKPRVRKRAGPADLEEDTTDSRKAKKTKKDRAPPAPRMIAAPAMHPSFILPADLVHSHSLPLFPPTRPTLHHQPYYQSCIPQTIPSEIIFPPLPHSSAYHQLSTTGMVPTSASTSTPGTEDVDCESSPTSTQYPEHPHPPAPSSTSSSFLSVPDLTPNRSSSSPPLSLPSMSEMDVDVDADEGKATKTKKNCNINASVTISGADRDLDPNPDVDGDDEDDDGLFNSSMLGPVQFWGESPKTSPDALEPGIMLLNYDYGQDEEDLPRKHSTKGKRKQENAQFKKVLTLPAMPASPTLNRKSTASKASKASRTSPTPHSRSRLKTPQPTTTVPSTPPRNKSKVHVSPVHTPLSHRGLHMSPSTNLAHYKSHLDPPPARSFAVGEGHVAREEDGDAEVARGAVSDPMRTPSRKRNGPSNTSGIFPPVTPKKLLFPANESPFRTPSGILGASPFRTLGSRAIFDPHDPGTLLDEELSRMGAAGHGDSPAGMFGRGTGALLYDSPNALENSPGKWAKWW